MGNIHARPKDPTACRDQGTDGGAAVVLSLHTEKRSNLT